MMQKKHMIIVSSVILAAILLVACGGSAAPAATPTTRGDAVAGKAKFDGTCISCHGPDAKGIQGLGKDLTISEFVKSQSDAELVSFIQKGRPASDPANTVGVDMPPKGGNPALSDLDILNIVAYMRSLQ